MPRNKQPFYHEAVVLFTATRVIERDELETALRSTFADTAGVRLSIVKGSLTVDQVEAEPGDPADLL